MVNPVNVGGRDRNANLYARHRERSSQFIQHAFYRRTHQASPDQNGVRPVGIELFNISRSPIPLRQRGFMWN